ncbi:hypothetical protein ILYODFUR_036661, partial [Ilyodon furcidens]
LLSVVSIQTQFNIYISDFCVCVGVQVTQVEETDPDVLRPGRCLILTIDNGVAFSRRSIPPFSTSCVRDTRRHPCERVCLRVFLQHLQAERTCSDRIACCSFQSSVFPE